MSLGCKIKQGIRTDLVVLVRMLTVSLQLALDVWLADNTMNKGKGVVRSSLSYLPGVSESSTVRALVLEILGVFVVNADLRNDEHLVKA